MTPSQVRRITPSAWGVFHDGVIRAIEGALPGNLVLTIEIGYLRATFEGEGSSFRVRLSGCKRIRYSEYDEEPTADLAKIQEREPEILYVTSEQPLVLDCVMGPLELEYEHMTVELDSGVQVSEQELVGASELYWNRRRERNRSDA